LKKELYPKDKMAKQILMSFGENLLTGELESVREK
jgi:hypothetical protein